MNKSPFLAFSLAVCAAVLLAPAAHAQVNDMPDGNVAGIPVNYTEAKVTYYPAPDTLTLLNGQKVTDADTWMKLRRPEIVHFYETNVYGRVPATAPKVTWTVASEDRTAMNGTAVVKKLVGHMGGSDSPAINVTLYTPAKATKPVPVILAINFNFGATRGAAPAAGAAGAARGAAGAAAPVALNATEASSINKSFRALLESSDPSTKAILDKYPNFGIATAAVAAAPAAGGAPIARLLEDGIGYATFFKDDVETDIEGPSLNPNVNIARKLGLAPGQTKPDEDEWGAIAAWAWGMSRVEDYFQTDKDVDSTRVAITGGSRLGKTVLWAGVNDTRFAMVIACSGGSGGAKLARRNYGETIAHLVAPTRYPYQFAANYAKFAAKPSDMPMDTNSLVAAMAPRALLLHTAANGDNWSDPKGEYLAAILATPAYELLGKKGLDRTMDQPMVTSEFVGKDLAFYLNNGGHAALNWDIAIQFMNDHFHPEKTAP